MPSACPASSRYLIFAACDPAECRQYTNVQLNTLPLAVFLARIFNRTLVLPPLITFQAQGQVDLYQDGGHDASNALFTRMSNFFNLSALSAEIDLIEWHDFAAVNGSSPLTVDHLMYDKYQPAASKMPTTDGRHWCVEATRHLLGLDAAIDAATSEVPPVGRLFDATARVASFRCGPAQLNHPEELERWAFDLSAESWQAESRTLAVLGPWWGTTNAPDEGMESVLSPTSSTLVETLLTFDERLIAEADAFIAKELGSGGGGGDKPPSFVSVHLRHGDYIQWRKQAPLDVVASHVHAALLNQSAGNKLAEPAGAEPAGDAKPARLVFLATNCRDAVHIDRLRLLLRQQSGVKLVRYSPPPEHAEDKLRTSIIEQLVAARAAQFLYTASSFYSHTIVRERRRRGLGPSIPMHGREQRSEIAYVPRAARKLSSNGEPPDPLSRGPGGNRKLIWEEPVFAGDELR